MSGHVVLLGDSVFDNRPYIGDAPAVIDQLRTLLDPGWQASLLATDGSGCADLASQIAKLPGDATHLAISVGGVDVLANVDLLDRPVHSTAETLLLLGERADAFEAAYRRAIALVRACGLPVLLCTVYNGCFELELARRVRVALRIFNDVIIRVAFEHGLQVIDVRLLCTEPADYADPVEPSSCGGEKIARAVARALGHSQLSTPASS